MAESNETTGIEKIYHDLLEQLKERDLTTIATSKNLRSHTTGEVLVESLSRDYLASHDGISARDQGHVSSEQKLAVVSYLLSDCTGPPAFDFIPFAHLGGYNIGRDKHMDKNVKQPILNTFADNYDLFVAAALKIGGTEQESDSADKHIWLFQVVPNLLIQIIFYEPDEDFPADIHILFDSKALEILGMKCLGFLPGYFTSALIEAASER